MGKITIKGIKNQKAWDNFSQKISPNNFLSSWQWADFNNLMGDETLRFGIYEDSKLVGICSAIVTKSRKGNFLLSPAGPLFLINKKSYWNKLIIHLTNISKTEKLKFIRIRPLFENTKKNRELLKSFGFIGAPVRAPAEVTQILDIKKTEEELLAQMRKTTRYLIKKAQKDGVQIKISTKTPDLEMYHKLEKNTVAKHKFTPFSKKYIKNQFEVFNKTNDALILLAKYKGKIISSSIITFYGDSAFYNHGASINTKIPASYRIQWEAILEAKRRGKKFYNFWGGITENPKDPWYGITLFKTGFGGQKFETIHAYDLPISRLYKPIAAFESFRYKLRGHSL